MISTRSFCQTPTHLLAGLLEGEVERRENIRVSGTEVNTDGAFENVFHGGHSGFFGEMRDGREMETDQFFFLHRVHPKSGNPHFPTMLMSTSVVRRTLTRDAARSVSARRFHTEPRPLETPEDWTDFQLERANYKKLSEYVMTAFAAFAHL